MDLTADWCQTSAVNKRTSLEIPSVQARLEDLDVVTMMADFTHGSTDITDELARRGRGGMPLVLVYPKAPDAPAIELPSAFNPKTMLAALDQAAL